MSERHTERQNAKSVGLDSLPPSGILETLCRAQLEAAQAVEDACKAIETAALAVSKSLAAGGKLAYVGAGSSGLMAIADGLELAGTFGIPAERVVLMLAGVAPGLTRLEGGPEDDADLAVADVRAAKLSESDSAICVSASGSTPYTLAALQELKRLGVTTIAIANNSGAPMLTGADIAITLNTPPEVIAGSTRMGAATAQKIALNMLSTLMGVHLGHVHDGLMVNVVAENDKLRERAARMVSQIADCSADDAAGFLELAGGSVKLAVLLAQGAADLPSANGLLARSDGNLRTALNLI